MLNHSPFKQTEKTKEEKNSHEFVDFVLFCFVLSFSSFQAQTKSEWHRHETKIISLTLKPGSNLMIWNNMNGTVNSKWIGPC